jgi:multidrug efflux pump subunit AcrA (membrane-fusion protein)
MKVEKCSTNKKRTRTILILVAVLAVLGLAYGGWRMQQPSATVTSKSGSTYETTAVKRGDLTQSAYGVGTLVASKTVNLSFAVSGKVSKLNVQLNNHVTAGEVLAVLDGLEKLKLDVENKQLALQTAQKAVDDLQSNAAASLAQALIDQSTAQAAYDKAKATVHYKGDNRCGYSLTYDYYMDYMIKKGRAQIWQNYLDGGPTAAGTDYGRDYILEHYDPLAKARDIAYANYIYCQGFTDVEIVTSQSTLQTATAALRQAKTTYQNLKANNGIDPHELQIAQAKVTDAQLTLKKSQETLTGATLVAPMDGTVVAIKGAAGLSQTAEDTTDSTVTVADMTFITLADLDNPIVTVSMDEADLQYFIVGGSAKVVFTSYPDQTYTGKVTEVVPQLVTIMSGSSVQGTVKLDDATTLTAKKTPLIGLDASVDVTGKQVQDVLIAPIKAVYQPAGSSAYVYILNSQGKPEKREVEVGLKTADEVEIRSGLEEGEQVITTNIKAQ